MQADPIDTQMDNALEYSRVLAEVEQEIKDAFAQHFAGKPAIALPHLAFSGGYDQIMLQGAREAINEALDNEDTDDALHGLLRGSVTLEKFRETLVARYIAMHAGDIVWKRTGISLPSKAYTGPDMKMLTILRAVAA